MDSLLDVGTLGDIPRTQARMRPEGRALIFEDRITTWAVLDARSNQVARALVALGVTAGSRVAILARDSDRVWESVFGIAKSRAVVMGINWRLAAREVDFVLRDGSARVLLVGSEFFDSVRPLLPGLETLVRVVVFEGDAPGAVGYEPWIASQPETDPSLPADPDDIVAQMYTSGTTGLPKGVMLAHRSFFAVVREMKKRDDPWIGWTPDDVSLSGMPSFHIGGIWWTMTGMNAGATQVILESFVAWAALDVIARHRVTKACMVPAMLQVLLAEPECRRTDFSALDCIVYGGSPIPLPFLKEALDVFRCRFAQIYGLTETGNTAVCLRPEDHRSERLDLLRAAGRPYPGVRIKILDDNGSELAPREVGEICIHSPANMLGYWNRPEATRETLVDGWVKTGDAGFLDEEGYVFVCDRKKDMIIYAGENVYPAEIESVLCEHPKVREAAVIGVPNDRWGELVKALVVVEPGESPKASDLIAHCRKHLADFKVPKSVTFIDALPRTPSGKIKKAELRRPYWEGRDRAIN